MGTKPVRQSCVVIWSKRLPAGFAVSAAVATTVTTTTAATAAAGSSATTTATAPATVATASAAAATIATILARASLVNSQVTAIQLLAIELGDRCFAFLFRGHHNKAKSA